MGKPPKRRIQGTRLTPKGTTPNVEKDRIPSIVNRKGNDAPSPWWVPALLFTFLGMGAVIIVLNYLGFVPGGEANNIYLLVGLGFILAGMITSTQLH